MPDAAAAVRAAIGLPDVFLLYQKDLWRAIDASPLTVIEKSRHHQHRRGCRKGTQPRPRQRPAGFEPAARQAASDD